MGKGTLRAPGLEALTMKLYTTMATDVSTGELIRDTGIPKQRSFVKESNKVLRTSNVFMKISLAQNYKQSHAGKYTILYKRQSFILQSDNQIKSNQM